MSKRDQFWDCVRGMAILLVVTTHYIGGVNPVCKCTSFAEVVASLMRQVACYGVPLFIFMAGYFVRIEKAAGEHWMQDFIWPKAKRIVIPYFIWSVLTILLWRPTSLLDVGNFLCRDLLLGYGIGIGYYITHLLQLIVITPLLVGALRKTVCLTFVVVVLLNFCGDALFYLAAKRVVGSLGLSVPVPFPGIFCVMWILPYTLGLAFRMFEEAVDKFLKAILWRYLIFAVAVAFAMQLVESCFWADRFISIEQYRLSVLLVVVVLCAVIFRVRRRLKLPVILSYLGAVSFLAYLTHMQLLVYFWAAGQHGLWMSRTNPIAIIVVLAFMLVVYRFIYIIANRLFSIRWCKIMAFA